MSSGRRVRVGLIGLGEVAQVVHLPVLEALGDRFALHALCDVSRTLLAAMGERYRVPEGRRHADFRALVAEDGLDAVLVLNSDEYHADCVVAAAERGLHVLVEKPMCIAPSEADAIIAARDAAGVEVMVGYMRRFAPAFLEAVQAVKDLDRITYVRVRDIIGPNRLIVDQAATVLRPDDIPPELGRDRSERAARLVREAIGDAPPELASAYRLLLGLNSHDLSAMRDLIGMPESVLAAASWNDGHYLTAILRYDGFYAVLETGIDGQARFDAHIEVYGDTRSVRIRYDTPYIRHLPTTMIVHETVGTRYTETVTRPTFTDPYTHELLAFHDIVTRRARPRTTPEDFVEDLRLFASIVEALRASGTR